MSKDFLQFLTPGPMTQKFGFSLRVLTSWITLGLALGLIFGIVMASSGTVTTTTPVAMILQSLFVSPTTICLFGFIGLGFDSMRGRRSEYDGWYWWIFPIVTYIAIGFWLTLGLLGFCLALAGVNLPSRPKQRPPKFNPEQFRKEVGNMKVEDFLKEFEEKFEQIEKKNQLAPEEKKVFKKVRALDRAALRADLKSSLTNDELEILFLILLKILSGELG